MGNVSPFQPKAQPSAFLRQLQASVDVAPLVNAVFWHDMKVGRVPQLTRLTDLTPEAQTAVLNRAVIASNLGEEAMRDEMIENGARSALRGLVSRRLSGHVPDDSPFLKLELDHLRMIAALVVGGALSYAAGNPPVLIDSAVSVDDEQ